MDRDITWKRLTGREWNNVIVPNQGAKNCLDPPKRVCVVGKGPHVPLCNWFPPGIFSRDSAAMEMCRIIWASSQRRPNWCIFRSGNPGGSGFWVKGNRWVIEGTKRVSLRASRSRGGRILTQLGGFQVSRQGEQGEQGEPRNRSCT
jgi:hypothetical protein